MVIGDFSRGTGILRGIKEELTLYRFLVCLPLGTSKIMRGPAREASPRPPLARPYLLRRGVYRKRVARVFARRETLIG